MIDINRDWKETWSDRWDALLLHSKLMLVGTAVLLVFGAVMFLVLEWDGVLREMSIPRRLSGRLFSFDHLPDGRVQHDRRGGVDQCDAVPVDPADGVGAGPCSTGGGFKVSTLTILVLRVWTSFRGRRQINVGRRTIPETAVDRAIATRHGIHRRGDRPADGAVGRRADRPALRRVGRGLYGQGV